MEEIASSNNGNQCQAAITFIALFAGLFTTSLFFNIAMVLVLVTIVYKSRCKELQGRECCETEGTNITNESNLMWSDDAPDYHREEESRTDLKASPISITSQDKMKPFQREKTSIENTQYEQVQ